MDVHVLVTDSHFFFLCKGGGPLCKQLYARIYFSPIESDLSSGVLLNASLH